MDAVEKLDELSHKFRETVMKTIAVRKKVKTLKKKTKRANATLRKNKIK